jgi:hypothetical protein
LRIAKVSIHNSYDGISQQVIAVIRVHDSAGKVIEMRHSVKDQKLDGQRQVGPATSELNPHFELSMICCAFLIADSSGALSFCRMSIAFCAEAVASFLLPSFA